MDLPSTLPTSTDNNTVILWVVGVLVVCVAVVGKILWAKMLDNERRLREELDRAHSKTDEAQKELLKTHGGVMLEQQKTQMMTNNAMTKMAEAVEKMTIVIESTEGTSKRSRAH
jgi:F0F1-type ATP synthase membrane subunit b/b'